MTTLLPAYNYEECPICLPELDRLADVLQRRFPDSDTHPGQIARRAAHVLWASSYYQGILHHHGHPTNLLVYGQSLKENQVEVSKFNDCVSCQSERESAAVYLSNTYPDLDDSPEWLQPELTAYFCKVMHWLGVLHELEHPVSLTDYSVFLTTGDI